jgi:hypothetical protein
MAVPPQHGKTAAAQAHPNSVVGLGVERSAWFRATRSGTTALFLA